MSEKIAKELVRIAKRLVAAPPAGKLSDAIKAFENAQDKFHKLGASDTEPRELFYERMDKVLGSPSGVQISGENPWSLYDDMPGSKAANNALTKAFRKAEEALKTSPYLEVKQTAKYYGIDL